VLTKLRESPRSFAAVIARRDVRLLMTGHASTVVPPGAVHTGLCEDPQACLWRLFSELVA
jgi:hypothetical protein